MISEPTLIFLFPYLFLEVDALPRVKLIASLGPSSKDLDTVLRMVAAGASGFRINFAHGDEGFWRILAGNVRRAEEVSGRSLTLITDLEGSSIRLGVLPKPLVLRKGCTAKLVLKERAEGEGEIPLPNERVFTGLEEGDVLVMDDGRVRLRVVKVSGSEVEVAALTDAVIKSRKGVVVQNKEFDLPALTQKDLNDLKFACSVRTDYVGLSYVRSAENVKVLKDLLNELGCDARVIAKIETRSAVKNISSIARVADVILVARGDLGMNFGLEEIPRIQRKIVEASLRAGKPVIVATQLLESMVENPVPTRAEIVDVYAAVSEGVDALMLTGETAAGKYPVEAVKWLSRIASRAEAVEEIRTYREGGPLERRYAKGVAELAEDLGAKIVLYSSQGVTAKHIASIRPSVRFYVAVPSVEVARRINILWGVNPLIVESRSHEEGLEEAFKELVRKGDISIGDLVVLTYGMKGEEQVIKVRRYV